VIVEAFIASEKTSATAPSVGAALAWFAGMERVIRGPDVLEPEPPVVVVPPAVVPPVVVVAPVPEPLEELPPAPP
jgi:hypothetical protein